MTVKFLTEQDAVVDAVAKWKCGTKKATYAHIDKLIEAALVEVGSLPVDATSASRGEGAAGIAGATMGHPDNSSISPTTPENKGKGKSKTGPGGISAPPAIPHVGQSLTGVPLKDVSQPSKSRSTILNRK